MRPFTKKVSGLFLCALIVVLIAKTIAQRAVSPIPEKPFSSPASPIAESTPVRAFNRSSSGAENTFEIRWREFQRRFGDHLDASFAPDRRLLRIRALDPGKPSGQFRPGDQASAEHRASEIVHAASELLGLNPSFALDTRAVRTDEISSQVEWVQTFHGIPLEPYGRVTVQLDSSGGLRGLYSTYVSDSFISNEPSLPEENARELVVSEIHFKAQHPERIGKGEQILFAPGPQAGRQPVELHYAYRYWIEGREVILSASTGKILSERDRRVIE